MPFAPFAPPLPRPLPLHVKVREGVKATAIDQAGTCTALTMETRLRCMPIGLVCARRRQRSGSRLTDGDVGDVFASVLSG